MVSGRRSHLNLLAITAESTDGQTTPVDLSRVYNRLGLTTDGRDFKGGFDGGGYSLSSNLLGGEMVWQGIRFSFGAPNGFNVVQAAGQSIPLPQGSFSRLLLLASAVYGNQPNQTFVVRWSDGSTKSYQQSISDWMTPQNYPGETLASVTAYRNQIEQGSTPVSGAQSRASSPSPGTSSPAASKEPAIYRGLLPC